MQNKSRSVKTINDLGMKVRVPYNHDLSLIEAITDYKKYIDSVYFPPSSEIFLTSGAGVLPPTIKSYDKIIKHIISKLSSKGINAYMLLNAYHVGQDVIADFKHSNLYAYLKKMHKNGLRYVTVADILLARNIKQYLPGINVEASVNAKIDSVTRALYWKEFAGVHSINILLDLNKRPELIKNIKNAIKVPIVSIAHEICLPDCPYEVQHCLSPIFHKKGPAPTFFNCGSMTRSYPWIVYQGPIIVPYNLRFYQGLIDTVKLAGRRLSTKYILADVKHYCLNMDSRAYFYNCGVPEEGEVDIHPYLNQFVLKGIKHPYLYEEPKEVFHKVAYCNRNCQECGWCKKIWDNFSQQHGFPAEFEKLRELALSLSGDKKHAFRLKLDKQQVIQEKNAKIKRLN